MSILIDNYQKLDKVKIEDNLHQHAVPGCAIGIFDRHTKLYATYGTRAENAQVNEKTSFRVASLTKPVFAFLCLQHVINGNLDLDTPLIEYHEGERYVDDDRIEQLTARHILSHQSGWPNWSRTSPLQFEFNPGEKFQYSGEGIIYLQNTLRKITGTPVFRLLDKLVYKPLGMTASALAPQFLTTDNRCQPHDTDGLLMERNWEATADMIDYFNRMPRHGNAAGTMWASIEDYTRFLYQLLFTNDSKIEQIRDLMTTKQSIIEGKRGWGLGIGLEEINGEEVMWHWGSDAGFKTFTMTFTDMQTGITIFTNGENGYEIYKTIIETLLDDVPYFISNKAP